MYLGVEISKLALRIHSIAKVTGKGKSHVGKMDAILPDSRLGARIKMCILINVRVQKLENAGGVCEGNAKLVEHSSKQHR